MQRTHQTGLLLISFSCRPMWMRPKPNGWWRKGFPPPRLRSKDFKNEKEFFNFRLGEISPGPAKRFTTTGQNIIQQRICIVERSARFISNRRDPLRQRYIEILPRSSYYASRWEWHTNETRFWRCKRPTPSLHAQQQKTTKISIFFPL